MPDLIDLDLLVNIDFEGSCLPWDGRSYPVELAACHVGSGETKSWLIRPHETWRDWDWCEVAAEVHGIERERLEREGRPADRVLAEFSAFVAGRMVVSDAETDQHWMLVLAEAGCGVAPVEIRSSAHLLKRLGVEGQTQDDPSWRKAERLARDRFPEAHRAESDARRGAEIIRLVAAWNGFLGASG